MEDFIEHLTEGAKRVARYRGRDFHGLVGDRNQLLDLALADAKARALEGPATGIKMPEPTNNVPAMPHIAQAETQRRGPGRPRKVSAVASEAPAKADLGAPRLAPAPSDPGVRGFMVSS
jgi:hypothetical protein